MEKKEETKKLVLKKKKPKWLRWVLALLLIGVAGATLWYAIYGNSQDEYEFVAVARMDLKEVVEITGNVEADATITLSFRESGQVTEINYEVGDRVNQGDVIAVLDNVDQQLALERARANLQAARANLNERLAGSTNERVQVAAAQVKQAEANADSILTEFENARAELDIVQQKYAADERAAEIRVEDAQDRLDFALLDQENVGDLDRQSVELAEEDLENTLATVAASLQSSLANLETFVVEDSGSFFSEFFFDFNRQEAFRANRTYFDVKQEFDPVFALFNIDEDIPKEELKDYALQLERWIERVIADQQALVNALAEMPNTVEVPSTDVAAARNTLNQDIATLSNAKLNLDLKYQNLLASELGLISSEDIKSNAVVTAENSYEQQVQALEQMKIDHQLDLQVRQSRLESLQAQYRVQEAAVEAAQAQLEEVRVGPRAVDVAALRAQVWAAEIDVALREEDFEKTLLRAPTNGVLSRQNVEIGEDITTALQREIVFEMIADDILKVEADIAEVDINKVAVGDKAELTFDAIGEEVFAGTITRIDPVETPVQDVVFYKAEVVIDQKDERIKPGMTTNVTITLTERNGVLTLPDRAILRNENGENFVRDLVEEEIERIIVETGIRDLEGNVEIVSGVEEGQEVILRTVNGS